MAANANGNIAKSNEPVQLVNREVYEIVNARLQTYAEIGGQYKGGLGSLKDLSDARWICDKVLGGLAEEDAHSFEELQNFIQTARKRFDLSKLTKSEWLQLVNLRPKDTGTFEAVSHSFNMNSHSIPS